MDPPNDDDQHPGFLDRSSRATRGKRMNKLLDDEIEEDEAFWNQDALKEEENDDEYEEEGEVADEFDSDFDEDESDPDDGADNEADVREKRPKKKLIYPGKPVAKKKKKKDLSKLEESVMLEKEKDVTKSEETQSEDKLSEQFTTPDRCETGGEVEEEKTVRKSTRTAVIVRQAERAERDAIRAALQATMKPVKRKKEGEEKRMTQEEMLLDAAQTEMKQEEVDRCQIQEWYPKFKPFSIKTIIHELPEPFIQYLLDDSGPFLLPESVTNDDALPNRIHKPEDEEDYEVLEGSEDESEQPTPPPSFPELEMKIKESIESLGGAVFPKLNWSSPKDTAWISPSGTLKCTSFSDIALLLRSSDSLVHDLCHAYDSCSDKTLSRPPQFYLALRKWYPSLRPEMEFRCFVHAQHLVGISQREVTSYYPVLVERKDELKEMIQDFFIDNVEGRFKSENYTYDVYITKDGKVKLMDFNPWCAFTLPLLFTWEELEEIAHRTEDVDFRIVESQCSVRPGLKTAVPYDYIDMSPGSGWDQFLSYAGDELQQQMRS